MKKKRKSNKRKSRTRQITLICIVILSLLYTFIYKQNNSQNVEIVKVSTVSQHLDANKTDNNVGGNEVNESQEIDKSKPDNIDDESINPRANRKQIEVDKNSFDAGKIQGFLSKNIKINDGKKIAFLTFDDGPSTTVTPKVLEILKRNDIKATFFIVGKQVEENPGAKNLLLEIYKDGHAVGNHTYSHNYSKLYPAGKVDTNAFMEEIIKTSEIMRAVLGQDFDTKVIRFPGGHPSWKGTEQIDSQLEATGYKYIDWNALVGDSEGGTRTKNQIINRYKQTFVGQEKVVILMHDTYGKNSTAEALQYIIDDLKGKGYEFKTLK
ncbi:polysaccharide deacetylase [Clostridium sp. YIM B02505]|uniref:Polysaccharide deacetylase n=1 Tax=Clostridium yunnanense TaxID=2800325 RepID=A0ABS1EVN9_9CLOT|nr:polysaccharide deacetylase [Clostridium yunnanense]